MKYLWFSVCHTTSPALATFTGHPLFDRHVLTIIAKFCAPLDAQMMFRLSDGRIQKWQPGRNQGKRFFVLKAQDVTMMFQQCFPPKPINNRVHRTFPLLTSQQEQTMGASHVCQDCKAKATQRYELYIPVWINDEVPQEFEPWCQARQFHEDGQGSTSFVHRCSQHPVSRDSLPKGIQFVGMLHSHKGFYHL